MTSIEETPPEAPTPPARFRVTIVIEDEATLTGFTHGVKIQDADTGDVIDNPDLIKDTPALYGLMVAMKAFYALHEKGQVQQEQKKRKVILPDTGVREHSPSTLKLLDKGKGRSRNRRKK